MLSNIQETVCSLQFLRNHTYVFPPTVSGTYWFWCRSNWRRRQQRHHTFLSAQYLVNQWLDSYQICLDIYSQLSLSRIPRDCLKHFEISVPRHIRFLELRKKEFEQPHLTNLYVIGLLKIELYRKYCGKEEKLLLSNSPLFHNIFYMLFDFHV